MNDLDNNCQTADRIAALEPYQIIDTPDERSFDEITELAANICEAPIALISLVTENRQWFKARIGVDLKETSLDVAICSHAILQKELFVIPDLTKDSRFQKNPFVIGSPYVRFCAAAVLETPEGISIGTLSVFDYKPRTLTDTQQRALFLLARQVMGQMELRKSLLTQRKNEETLKLAFEASDFLGTWVWDVPGNVLYADARFSDIFGIDPDKGRKGVAPEECFDQIHLEDVAMVRNAVERALVSGEPYKAEYRLAHPDGSYRWAHARGRVHMDESGKPLRFPGMIVDITERKRSDEILAATQRELRETQARLEATLVASEIATWVWNIQEDRVFADENLARMFGVSREDANGGPIAKYVGALHVDDQSRVAAEIAKTLEGETTHFDTDYRLSLEGEPVRWVTARGKIERDATGKPVTFPGVVIDITDRKKAEAELVVRSTELQRANEQLHIIQSQLATANERLFDKAEQLEELVEIRTAKLKESILELESFSYSISHDMRSPLRAMHGYADALLQDHGDQLDPEAKHYLERIHKGATRLDLLVRDVLAYSKVAKGDIGLRATDMSALIVDIVQTYPNLQPSYLKVICSALPRVMAHEGLLTQVISNLFGNAIKFATPGVFPEVRISAKEAGPNIQIWFEDNGIGIAPQHHQEIFQIFGRVYPDKQYEGTGIGLAVVKRATERMGGSAGVVSELGKGSQFWISLKKAL